MSRCLYTSFFTKDYWKPAAALIQSLREHSLDNEVAAMPDTGRWIWNCALKPKFIGDMMARHPDRPLVWTDADSIVRQCPTVFEGGALRGGAAPDAAVCEYKWLKGCKETFSGTMWFAPTPGARRLVEIWVALQARDTEVMDQHVLAKAVELARAEGVRVALLPVAYCYIFDFHKQEHPDIKPVFEHFQHSRIRKEQEVSK